MSNIMLTNNILELAEASADPIGVITATITLLQASKVARDRPHRVAVPTVESSPEPEEEVDER